MEDGLVLGRGTGFRERKKAIAALCLAWLCACASPQAVHQSDAGTAGKSGTFFIDYMDVSRLSGQQEANSALVERLRAACHLPDLAPSPIPELALSGLEPATGEFKDLHWNAIANGEECIKSRLVSAFDAKVGEPICGRESNVSRFVACIIAGAYRARIAENLGIESLAVETNWKDAAQAASRISDVLYRKVLNECRHDRQWQANGCMDDLVLPVLEVGRFDVAHCPGGDMRSTCIVKVGLARFVDSRLVYVF